MLLLNAFRDRSALLGLLLCAGLVLPACSSRKLASTPERPTTIRKEAQGWTRVTQPGWFSILMPRPPDVGELTTTSPEGGTLVMKRLSAGMDKGYVSIAYAELQNFDDHDAMLAEVRKGLQAAGARPINVNDVVVEGRDGVEEYLDLPPGSEVNHSSVPMRAQVRVLLDQNRAYVLLGVEPAAIGDSALPQFFSSFSFAPAPIPPGTPSAQQPATPAH